MSFVSSLLLDGCDRVGQRVRVLGRPIVRNEGRIDVGHDVTIHPHVRLTTTHAGTITLGDRVTLQAGVTIISDGEICIEDDVVVGPNTVICDRDERGAGSIVVARGSRVEAGARIGAPRPTREAPRTATTTTLTTILTSDFTIDELAARLASADEHGLAMNVDVAPFDQVIPTLLGVAARQEKIDLAIVWTRPEAVSSAFRALLDGGPADVDRVMADVDSFARAILASASVVRFTFVASFARPPWQRGLGMRELRSGPTSILSRMNLRLVEALERATNVFVLDAQRWIACARDGGVDPKLWHAGKLAFTSDVIAEAALDIRAAARGALGGMKKLVVVDLDDTLWGGIVGDVGWEHLKLGGHDADGEGFVELQRKLVALTRRGIALAVVSKNEESTALEAMRAHPEMIVRPDLLAAHRINWNDKAENIVRIAEELNMGLQSVVFIDDNPAERARVREALPEVFVPEWPRDPSHYARALESLRCFDAPSASKEDLERNAMYATERKRTELRGATSSLDEWLSTLGLVVRFERVAESNATRAAQLLNKTNQMNLRTRRMSEAELVAWARDPSHEAWAVHVTDRFGDAGLTGLLGITHARDEVAELDDYVLSCRVMGRRVEEAMLWAAAQRASSRGAKKLVIAPIVTKKNKPCCDFFANAQLERDGDAWMVDLARAPNAPEHVSIEGLA